MHVEVKVFIWHTRGVVCVWEEKSNLDWSLNLESVKCEVVWGCCFPGLVGFLCDLES